MAAAAAASSSSYSRRESHRLREKPDIGFKIVYKTEPDLIESTSDLVFGFMILSHGTIYTNGVADTNESLIPELTKDNFGLFDPFHSDTIIRVCGYSIVEYINTIANTLPSIVQSQYNPPGSVDFKANIKSIEYKLRDNKFKTSDLIKLIDEPELTPENFKEVSNRLQSIFNLIITDPKLYVKYLPLLCLSFYDDVLYTGIIAIEYNRRTNKIHSIGHNLNRNEYIPEYSNRGTINYILSDTPMERVSLLFVGDVINKIVNYFKEDLFRDISDPKDYPKFIFFPQSCRYVKGSGAIPKKIRPDSFTESPTYIDIQREARLLINPGGEGREAPILRTRVYGKDMYYESSEHRTREKEILKEISLLNKILDEILVDKDDKSSIMHAAARSSTLGSVEEMMVNDILERIKKLNKDLTKMKEEPVGVKKYPGRRSTRKHKRRKYNKTIKNV